jgi:hypothetical protein
MVHTLVLIAYVFIAVEFAVAFIYHQNRKAKKPLILLSIIFVLCATTRFLLEFQIINWFTYALEALLLIASIGFVATNQAGQIVASMSTTESTDTI